MVIIMARCCSCDQPLLSGELIREITLEDDTELEIHDTFCNKCLECYVYNVDQLDSREYAFEHITEVDFFPNYKNFRSYSE